MAVLENQQSSDEGGLARSGSTVRKSNFNGKTIAVFDEERGMVNYPANSVQFFDDFLGDALDARYSGAAGTDPQAVAPAVNAQAGGVVRLVTGDAGTGYAADISALTHELNWTAAQGGLYMEARIKAVSSVADICINVGFTDAKGAEEPFSISGTTITSNATDAVCFVFDTAQTNDFLHLQGVKAGTDTAIKNSGVALVANTWIKLAIAVDSSGNAEFFINDVSYGTVANAVTAATALTPVITATARTTTSKTVDADYLLVLASR